MSMATVDSGIAIDSVASRTRGILFDYGNTLVRVRDGKLVLQESLADAGYVIDTDLASVGMDALKEYWHKRYSSLPRGQRWTEDIRLDCYRTSFSVMGLKGDLSAIARGVDQRWAARERGGLYEDVKSTLEVLDEMKLSLGILSQTKMTGSQLKEELESLLISKYFRVVLTSEDLGYDKPDTRFFHEGSKEIGLKNVELWYVGNRYYEDVVGARNAGITPVLVERRSRHKSRDCISVPSLLSLESLLRGC